MLNICLPSFSPFFSLSSTETEKEKWIVYSQEVRFLMKLWYLNSFFFCSVVIAKSIRHRALELGFLSSHPGYIISNYVTLLNQLLICNWFTSFSVLSEIWKWVFCERYCKLYGILKSKIFLLLKIVFIVQGITRT